MTVLKMTYQGSNFKPNSTMYDITVTTDSDITNADVDTILPNNGSRFGTLDNIKYIPSGSSATIYTPIAMVVCSFIAELGTVSTTNYNEGIWKVLARVVYKS
jgi:hypothetical protein